MLRPLERRPARQALVQQRTQRIYVGRRPVFAHLARRLLRRHVRRRPHDRPRLAHRPRSSSMRLASPKSVILTAPRLSSAGRSPVSGRDAPPPRRWASSHRPRSVSISSAASRRRALRFQLVGERAAVAELQREVRLAARARRPHSIWHDIRMLKRTTASVSIWKHGRPGEACSTAVESSSGRRGDGLELAAR